MGAGATVHTVVVENAVTAHVGDLADLIGLAAASMPSISGVSQAGIAIPNRAERRRGVAVYAGGDLKLYMGAASGALAVGAASVDRRGEHGGGAEPHPRAGRQRRADQR